MKTAEMTKTDVQSIFDKQKKYQYVQRKTTAKERIAQLRKLQKGIAEREEAFVEAMQKDLAKPPFETVAFEIAGSNAVIEQFCENLEEWMKREVKPSTLNPNAKIEVKNEPRGVVLVMGPWNFPAILVLEPLVCTIAAGNCAVVKPSEITPNISHVLADLISSTFDPEFVAVVEGGVEETTELLKFPFDHIFLTGSPKVGKIVMKAAAKNLTSVTLELGGKSPFIVDEQVNLEKAAKVFAHKKTINTGQVCLAPDYGFVKKEQQEKFISLAKKAMEEMYYPDGDFNRKDISRIVNQRNYERVKGLFEDAMEDGAQVAFGGVFHDEELRIEPTILTNVSKDSTIMQEEIFGPIFPILNYENMDEVVDYINSNSKPLGLYMFSDNQENIDKVINGTSSGGVTINEVFTHAFDPALPFGGVNGSGMGAYHGKHGFMELSHQKSILYDTDAEANMLLAPPFEGKLEKMKESGASIFG